ncbi:aspartate/glutamate racemase family protein [Pseudomonas sp. REP124]|uniref:aspartate/glutamate racemase family protein n=1 Tax=Pseudomonas sp. REP124 TaxID=2875731 RepID=UPI001CCEC1D3|nr:aspartate/glutamate racemase family protein [Pseudomonas sp. REP124]MBZ9780120.1 aspartate/glutamate racemase family protein [Pseudomonas sp. REP124]
MKAPRIYLIHATPVAIAPITEAFTRLWPQARLANLLEDSLSGDLAEAGEITEALNERFLKLATYAADSGADAILFTCSAFGGAIDLCKRSLTIPVLKPNEAMIEEALEHTRKVSILATFEPAIASMTEEFMDHARQLGIGLELETRVCPGAFDELRQGNAQRHDALIVDSARLPTGSELLCFAQFSMTSAAQQASQASGLRVLTTPDSAVLKLRRLLKA